MTEQPDVSRLYQRPLARAHALAETWDGDHTPITRDQAAEALYAVLATTGWTQTEAPAANLTVVPTEPDFGIDGCTCKPFTHQGGTRYLDQPGDTVDMICGWEIGDCPHHKRRTAPAVGEPPMPDTPFPRLSPVDRRGELRCGSTPSLDAPTCGAPAIWHIAWTLTPGSADFSLVCDQHMAQAQRELAYSDRHPADVNCDMPGTGWLLAQPSRCVPVNTTEAASGKTHADLPATGAPDA